MSLATMPLRDLTPQLSGGDLDTAFRDASMTWMRFMGIDPNDPTTFGTLRDYAIALEDEPWVYACCNIFSQAVQSVPIRVYVREGKELVPGPDVTGPAFAPAARLQHLLDWVNPIDGTGSDLKAFNAVAWNIWGGYYIRKVRGKYGGEPQELYWLPVPDVQPDAPDGRAVAVYHYRPAKSTPADIKPADMIVHKRPNPRDPVGMLSPLSAVRNEIQVQINASIHTNNLLKNRSIPPFVVVAQKGSDISAADKGVLQRVLKALRGPANAGRTPIITEPVDIKTVTTSSADAEYIQARQIARQATLAVLHIPPIIAGDDDKTNVYGNIRDARRVFWQDTLIPFCDGQADAFQNWLVPDFDPGGTLGLTVAYDYSQIEALQEPFATQVQAWTMLQDRGVVVPNETRSHFRLGKPTSWGDQPMPFTRLTLKGDAVTGTGLGTALYGDTPVPAPDLTEEPGGLVAIGLPDTGGSERAATRLTAYGKDLYRHPAVRAFMDARDRPLDATWLLGEPVPDAVRTAIEAGLRRRASGDQLATALRGTSA